jgi:hypothetical protein
MEYLYCCLESQMPDPLDADMTFDFGSHERSCDFYLKQALKAIQLAQSHQDWDKYSLKAYYGCDICLEDGLIAIQTAITVD